MFVMYGVLNVLKCGTYLTGRILTIGTVDHFKLILILIQLFFISDYVQHLAMF